MMNLTVNQLLNIVGRLEDSPGFDTPRERFRRFLSERMTDAQAARLVIQECRQMSGEQSHRALHDAVVLTGRLFGFRTAFNSYQHDPGTAPIAGQWESRRRLRVILTVCTGQLTDTDVEALSRVVRSDTESPQQAESPCIGLIVLTPFCSTRTRIEEILRTHTHPELRLISLAGILRMADMFAPGQLTHDHVLRLLNPDVIMDSLLDVIDRSKTEALPGVERDAVSQASPTVDDRTPGDFWIAAIRLADDTPAAQFVDSMIANRRVLAVNPASQGQRAVEPGDSICVCIAGRGFVADARVAEIVTDGSSGVRDSEQFAQVLKLDEVTVYAAPVVPTPGLIRRIKLAPGGDTYAVVTPVSRQDFELATRAAVPSGHAQR